MRRFNSLAQFFCAYSDTPAKVFGAFALAVVLGGCASAAEPRTVQSPRCSYEGRSGMCVIVDHWAPRINPAALEAAYLQAKRDVESRYRLDLSRVAGPTVHVMAVSDFARLHPIRNRLDGDLGGDHGWTGFANGEIRITGPAVMRHEAFHYLLWKAGYPNPLNAAHEHPAFDEYRDGDWLPKRATPRATSVSAQGTPSDFESPLPASSTAALRESITQ